jgi:Domain of unknown function (DUF4157)
MRISFDIAQLIMRSSASGVGRSACSCGASKSHSSQKCEKCAPTGLQRKLAVGAANDPLELEADRVAAEVTRPALVATGTATPRIQRRAATADTIGPAPHSVECALAGAGAPLNADLRQDMEQRFGHDFSRVRIHHDDAAAQSARDVHAHAYTAGHNIVFGAGQFAPQTSSGLRLLAHELTHVVQQSTGQGAQGAAVLRRDASEERIDAWDALGEEARGTTRELWNRSEFLRRGFGESQTAQPSSIRSDWLKYLTENLQVRINELDDDSKVPAVKNDYEAFESRVYADVAKATRGWRTLEGQVKDEIKYYASRENTDSKETAKVLGDEYKRAKERLDKGAIKWLTTEDYSPLKAMFDSKYHVDVGILRGARERAKALAAMLRVVEELKREGESADTYIPGWEDRTQYEIDHLQTLIDAKMVRGGSDYSLEFGRLREDLITRLGYARRARKPEKSTLEKAADAVGGAIEAVVGPFIEAAKQLVDLAQIVLHFASGGHYEPKFQSDLSKAAEQGATTGELLKGMVTGILETPERLYKAIEAGDWEGIGRETANIWMISKGIRDVPSLVKSAPAMVARLSRAVRILKARSIAFKLHEGRILPQAASKVPATRVPGPELYKASPKAEPTILKDAPVKDTPKVDTRQKTPEYTDVPLKSKAKSRKPEKEAPAEAPRETIDAPVPKKEGKGSTRKSTEKQPEGDKFKGDKGPDKSTADDRMARMDKAREEKLARDAKAKELREKPENQAKKNEPVKEKSVEDIKAEKKAQRAAQQKSVETALEKNRDLQLQIYTEIERANQALKKPMSDKARSDLIAKKNELARQANRNLEARQGHEATLADLEITPYDRARAYSYSDSAGKSVVRRASGLDEMSKKPIREPSIDHVVPVDEIVNFKGYDRLFPEEQRLLLSNERNLRMMEKELNSSKGSKSWAKWKAAARHYGETVVKQMIELEAVLRQELKGNIIKTLADRGVYL